MRYMVSRQVQNESEGCVCRSAGPAIARWNAFECRLAIPGRRQPAATASIGGAGRLDMAGRTGCGCGLGYRAGVLLSRAVPMLENLAILALVLLAVVLVLAKSRRRLLAPGARRSRGEEAGTASGAAHRDGDGGDGGGDA